MARELTIGQMREIVLLRRRHPHAEVVAHQKPWGIIVEARSRGQVLELQRHDWTGAVIPDRRIRLAA